MSNEMLLSVISFAVVPFVVIYLIFLRPLSDHNLRWLDKLEAVINEMVRFRRITKVLVVVFAPLIGICFLVYDLAVWLLQDVTGNYPTRERPKSATKP